MEQINPALLDADQISIDRCHELLGDEAILAFGERVLPSGRTSGCSPR
jgi:hypothetical protein